MKNFITIGDNLKTLRDLPDESFDFGYLDPLFNSSQIWSLIEKSTKEIKMFEDIWVGGRESYLYDIEPRIRHIYRCLKETGSLVIHCDTNMSHYLKVLMDEIFGENCFRNDISWLRTQGPYADSYRVHSKTYGKQHDCLLWFSKHPTKYKGNVISHNLWSEEKVKKKFNKNDNDGKGFYNWERQYSEAGKKFEERLDNNELKKTNVGYYYKRYYNNSTKGYIKSDIWIDIKPIAPNSKEKKWPTEKPESLLYELISRLTDYGDTIFEGYMGSAPACAVAAKMGRNFIGCDISPIAFNEAKKRLNTLVNDIRTPSFSFEEIKNFYDYNIIRNMNPFEFETIMINELASSLGSNNEPFPNPPNKQRKDGKIDGFILSNKKMIPVQVKRSDKVNGNTITVTKDAIKNKSNLAYIIAFSFTAEAKTFVKRYKIKENIDIKLIQVNEIVNLVYSIDVELSLKNNNIIASIKNPNEACETINYSWIIFYNKSTRSKNISPYGKYNQFSLDKITTYKRPFEIKCCVTDNCGGIGENIIMIKE